MPVERMDSLETPMVVRVLSDYVKEWKRVEAGGILIQVNGARFPQLLVKFIPITLSLDSKTHFSCQIDFVREGEMDERRADAYRRLKRAECTLQYQGFLKKHPNLVFPAYFGRLKSIIPDFSPDDGLIKLLLQDEEVMKLLNAVKPDRFEIILHSYQIDALKDASSAGDLLAQMALYYRDPTRITWVLSVTKMITRGLRAVANQRGMFEILKLSSDAVSRFSEDLLS